ncbi:MAG: hypothetical protein IE913_03130 [Halothiobacillus sp.]|nr:hypothetical protein [Halothiobacillus sp.]
MLDQWLQSLMPFIQHLSGWIYWIAFLAALVETVLVVGLFLPGSTLLLLLGALSAGSGGPGFLWLFIFAVAGATLSGFDQASAVGCTSNRANLHRR